MKNKVMTMCMIAAVCVSLAAAASAVNIVTVPVGNVGNTNDTHGAGYGAVNYTYNIGKYEVTAGQYTEFLNAVAATDTYGLYNSSMNSSTYGCQITRNGSSGNYTYDFSGRPSGTEAEWADRPVNFVSFWDALRFANWLHNGQGSGDTETGAYTLTAEGIANNTVTRNTGWNWAVTSENEWYKAAYHKNNGNTGNYFDYPTSSDTTPSNDLINPDPGNNATFWASGFTIGSPYWQTEVGAHENSESPYGTFDQGGNVWEWNESVLLSSYRGMRGGGFDGYYNYLRAADRSYYSPPGGSFNIGFRVSEVPEPATIALLAAGGLALLKRRRR